MRALLTGRVAVRISLFGRIVLRVEEAQPEPYRRGGVTPPRTGEPDRRTWIRVWRDARQSDLRCLDPLQVKADPEAMLRVGFGRPIAAEATS